MTPEQRANCERLLEFLETKATEQQCDMTVWARNGDMIPPQDKRGTPECGTAACLAGWGALLCAPTVDNRARPWDNSNVLHDIAVPLEWARKHTPYANLGVASDPSLVNVDIGAIGKAVLGPELEKWFDWQDGPSECDMTNREWMAAVLRKELHIPYDERLDDVTPPFDREP